MKKGKDRKGLNKKIGEWFGFDVILVKTFHKGSIDIKEAYKLLPLLVNDRKINREIFKKIKKYEKRYLQIR